MWGCYGSFSSIINVLTLCIHSGEHGEVVRSVITTAEDTDRRELIVFSRRIGDYSTVQRHIALLCNSSTSPELVVEESVLSRPDDFPPSGLRVCFQVYMCTCLMIWSTVLRNCLTEIEKKLHLGASMRVSALLYFAG